jgi:hypothetical protein
MFDLSRDTNEFFTHCFDKQPLGLTKNNLKKPFKRSNFKEPELTPQYPPSTNTMAYDQIQLPYMYTDELEDSLLFLSEHKVDIELPDVEDLDADKTESELFQSEVFLSTNNISLGKTESILSYENKLKLSSVKSTTGGSAHMKSNIKQLHSAGNSSVKAKL